jgi:hypothetical protein
MDEFEKRLTEDAGDIDARVSPEFQTRLDAALRAASEEKLAMPTRQKAGAPRWWVSSLTGLTAAAAIIFLMNLGDPAVDPLIDPLFNSGTTLLQANATTLPDWIGSPALKVETAVLTAPLEQELLDLQSDLEKARKNVERDVSKAF